MRQERDLVLPPNTFAYVLDRTKGKVSAYVGPFRSSLSDTDHLVVWRGGRFQQISEVGEAIQPFIEAGEGQYIVLGNPVGDDPESSPKSGSMNDSTTLDIGRKVVIPGPSNFPLWPGQSAQVIDGHHLRHNQYLVVRVYEPEAAKRNAARALVAPQTGPEGEGEKKTETKTAPTRDLTMGKLMVIKGTEVSFYVPPTGIEVVPEATTGQFVREAATLEQLDYAVLLDESGSKRYERGPAVVFPEPTETFATDDEGNRKFRAIELNPQSGLYIKVIAPYEEGEGDDTVTYTEGQELFLTGEDTPIYFPRVEHSIIEYNGKRKHHAIAVPEGEGRYALDRTDGKVTLVTGPKMFLPDPRTQVIVRRVLPDKLVKIMYPGNDEALQVNQMYAAEQEEVQRVARERRGRVGGREAAGEHLLAAMPMDVSYQAKAASSSHFAGEKMSRGTEYTPPRTVTLDTKYEGAVTVSVWPGYAVLVMDKSGHRRVEMGPKNVLLQYDESLMVLSLSTGRPKSGDNKVRTPYLRTVNNSITDRVTVETKDLVPVTLDFTLRVNFEGQNRTQWFDVEDYVSLLTDHCRSKLRNLAKRHEIQEFYTNTIDLIRDSLLGKAGETRRPGLPFTENGMRLVDVEVLSVEIQVASVAQLLEGAMDTSLRGAIAVSEAQQETERQAKLEGLERTRLAEREKTQEALAKASLDRVAREITVAAADAQKGVQRAEAEAKLSEIGRDVTRADDEQHLLLRRAANEVETDRLKAEVEQSIERAKALSPELVAAIDNFGDKLFVEKMMEAVGPVALTTGVTTADAFASVFKDTPFAGMLDSLAQRPFALANGGNGTSS